MHADHQHEHHDPLRLVEAEEPVEGQIDGDQGQRQPRARATKPSTQNQAAICVRSAARRDTTPEVCWESGLVAMRTWAT